jgi:preprotein translocase subunit SecE
MIIIAGNNKKPKTKNKKKILEQFEKSKTLVRFVHFTNRQKLIVFIR